MVSYSKVAWNIEGWVVLASTHCTQGLITRPFFSCTPHPPTSSSPSLYSPSWSSSYLLTSKTGEDQVWFLQWPSQVSNHSWQWPGEIKLHNNGNIVPSPESSHKRNKYCCIFFHCLFMDLYLRRLVTDLCQTLEATDWGEFSVNSTAMCWSAYYRGFSSFLDLGTDNSEQGDLTDYDRDKSSLIPTFLSPIRKKSVNVQSC